MSKVWCLSNVIFDNNHFLGDHLTEKASKELEVDNLDFKIWNTWCPGAGVNVIIKF